MSATGNAHTPGPWERRGHLIYSKDEGPGVAPCIAHVYSGSDSHGLARHAIGGAEADRNARLIAAAPELLAACEEALAALERIGNGPVERLRSALAAARGGAR